MACDVASCWKPFDGADHQQPLALLLRPQRARQRGAEAQQNKRGGQKSYCFHGKFSLAAHHITRAPPRPRRRRQVIDFSALRAIEKASRPDQFFLYGRRRRARYDGINPRPVCHYPMRSTPPVFRKACLFLLTSVALNAQVAANADARLKSLEEATRSAQIRG